ncbi:MAG: MBL fold metallo-hydrolase [Myxococcales bacterium]|nr:MBL fold metallo-hydrolase [Myxococcales bacterium]
MKIQVLRNATTLLSVGGHRILVDPMLSEPGALPGFKVFGGGRRPNPLVPLPATAAAALAQATAVLVTHEHPDHFDRPGLDFARRRGLTVWASPVDAPNLRRKGLDARELRDGVLGMAVEVVPSRHGRGLLGWLMGPVAGVYLAHPDEPSLYVVGDSVLTDAVLDAIDRLQPDVILAPAGAANMGLGGDILFSLDELVALARRAPGEIVFNHLEALDHCPTTRAGLAARLAAEGLLERTRIPADGEELVFETRKAPHRRPRSTAAPAGGAQKWITARFAGT